MNTLISSYQYYGLFAFWPLRSEVDHRITNLEFVTKVILMVVLSNFLIQTNVNLY